MARIELAPITRWITTAAVQHGNDLAEHLAQRLGVSRRRAQAVLRQLVGVQWLQAEGEGRRRRHRPGALRQVVKQYALQGLMEDAPWRQDFAPFFVLPAAVHRMAQHALTELLNNAIDHSGGTQVTVSMRQTPLQLQLLVSDDGCGLFNRIERSFAIDDPRLAMMELAKGKLSSSPDCHSGHGLFFTSRLADVFDLHANQASFQSRAWDSRGWRPGKAGPVAARAGTSIYLAIAMDTPRTLDAVLREHSQDRAGYAFERTRVPLHLLAEGQALASRADARRVASRLDAFRSVELDFDGIADIGHGFADELFRVFSRRHPGLELLPLHMAPPVAAMVAAVQPPSA
jgi:anti-sigma regulatory factor (Ser/Thr protein kinase)